MQDANAIQMATAAITEGSHWHDHLRTAFVHKARHSNAMQQLTGVCSQQVGDIQRNAPALMAKQCWQRRHWAVAVCESQHKQHQCCPTQSAGYGPEPCDGCECNPDPLQPLMTEAMHWCWLDEMLEMMKTNMKMQQMKS